MNPIINEGARKAGFSPSQWILGQFPRSVGDYFDDSERGNLGCISENIDE